MKNEILDLMSEERIFDVSKTDSGDFEFTEGCDNYFQLTLTPAQLMQLTVELRQLLND